ncbi:MAG: hypothetical protein ACYCZI_10550 [Metallibacterium scheffleri]
MTDQAKMMVVEFKPSPSYATGVAQGVVLTGPTSDGFVHVNFVRDIMLLAPETLIPTPTVTPTGKAAFTLARDPSSVAEPKLYREVVATISVPAMALRAIADVLIRVADDAGMPPFVQPTPPTDRAPR